MKKLILFLITFSIISCNSTRYIYIVRHAEKADSTITAGLSSAGHKRALALRDMLLHKNIDMIFATTIHGTQETARPFADSLHKSLQIYRYNAIDSIVNVFREIKNKNIL